MLEVDGGGTDEGVAGRLVVVGGCTIGWAGAVAVIPSFCRWMASNTFQLANSQIQTNGCKEMDRLVRASGSWFHELHYLGTPDFLQSGFFGVHSRGLPLQRRRSGWHRNSQNAIHGPGQMWIGIETQRRRRRHLCEIRRSTQRVMICVPEFVPQPLGPAGPSKRPPTSDSCGRYPRIASPRSVATARGGE